MQVVLEGIRKGEIVSSGAVHNSTGKDNSTTVVTTVGRGRLAAEDGPGRGRGRGRGIGTAMMRRRRLFHLLFAMHLSCIHMYAARTGCG